MNTPEHQPIHPAEAAPNAPGLPPLAQGAHKDVSGAPAVLAKTNQNTINQRCDVNFCRDVIAVGNEEGALIKVASTPDAITMHFWVAGLGLCIALAYGVSSLIGIPTWQPMIIGGVGFAILFATVRRSLRPPRAPQGFGARLKDKESTSMRLRVIVPDEHHAAAVGDSRESPFEPRVYRLFMVIPERGVHALFVYFLGVAATLLAAYLIRPVVPAVWKLGYFQIMTVCIVSAAPLMFVWPTYLRLTPGRMELLRFGMLGQGPPRITEWHLKDADTVRIDLRNKLVTVNSGLARQPTPIAGRGLLRNDHRHTISIRYCTDNLGLARAVLDAATSPELSPMPPEDALSG